MPGRTLVLAATNLLAKTFLVIPTDRKSPAGAPVNALFGVARALQRALSQKPPARSVAVVDASPDDAAWPSILKEQLAALPEVLRALGIFVVTAGEEHHVVASYARAAREAGDDVLIVGVDKRFAQLVAERVSFYDANKDVRYTPEIVEKRFTVAPARVGEWLALVGDDSGNEILPGVKGIGAKGATEIIRAHASIEDAIADPGALAGRLGKALQAAKGDIPVELARGRLDTTRSLPVPIDAPELAYTTPDPAAQNALLERLGFVELLVAETRDRPTNVGDDEASFEAALAEMANHGPVAVVPLFEDPEPVRQTIAGVGLAAGSEAAFYVPFQGPAAARLRLWLEDASSPKTTHDLVSLDVELRRAGVRIAGVVGDSASASHLTEPSGYAPHDLTIVAKHVKGRAIPEEESVRGVGKQRKAWRAMPVSNVAAHAGDLARAAASVWRALGPTLEPKLLADYLSMADVCVRMELAGLAVDPSELDRAEAAFAGIEAELDAEIVKLAGHPFNINSSKQLGDVLFQELGLPIASHTKTGWSTSIEALEKIEHAHPIVPLVLRWRALRRLRDNWVNALRRAIDVDGRVHSRFNPARSFSGQIVNSNPDLGRVPGRTPEMARIRRAFVASPGWLLMSVDFNQLGLHVLAHLTKDPALVEPLRARADMHRLTAAAILDLCPEQISFDQRQLGKVVNFATFAGQGASALALQLGVSAQQAKEYIARFDRHYALVRAFQDEQLRLAKERGYIETIAGRRWPIGGLEAIDNQLRSYAERLARRATHEASVQDVSRRALLEADRAIAQRGLRTRPLLQILDEVLFEVPEDELRVAAETCANAMKHAYELEVPLVVGVEAGKNWADLEPVT
jgi:DNA polymerase-1